MPGFTPKPSAVIPVGLTKVFVRIATNAKASLNDRSSYLAPNDFWNHSYSTEKTDRPDLVLQPNQREDLRLTLTMICDYCQSTILRSSETWGYHHPNKDDFENSFLNGCVFCSRLAKHMERRRFCWIDKSVARDQDGKTQDGNTTTVDPLKCVFKWQLTSWPIFRWTTRKLVKTREIQDRLCVTFRPLPGFDVDGMGVFKSLTNQNHTQPNSTTNDKDTQKALPDIAFYFYQDQGPSVDACPQSRELGSGTDSEQTWEQIRAWIRKCSSEPSDQCSDGHHDGCRRKPHIPQGIRILDIGPDSSQWPPAIKLIERDSRKIDNERYVSLSHCWGRKHFVQLRRNNYADFTGPGIPWHQFQQNQNFVGAIRVAQKLGVRYVWIDSLCIIQGDRADWSVQAGKMKEIYGHSYCNIAASSSPDRDGGLFYNRDPHRVAIVRYTGISGLFQGHTWRIIPDDLWTTSLLDEVLYHRAWVFQERILAPRLLHFTSDQVFWECAAISACEALPDGLPDKLDFKARDDRDWRRWLQMLDGSDTVNGAMYSGSLDSFWVRAVHFFTSCDITKQSDTLEAIRGIADLISEVREVDRQQWYKAQGLWEEALVWELPWTVSDWSSASRPTHDDEIGDLKLSKEARELSFPSWSWASIRNSAVDTSRFLQDLEELDIDRQPNPNSYPFLAKPTILTHSSLSKNKARLLIECPVGSGRLLNEDGRPTLRFGSGTPTLATTRAFPDSQIIMKQLDHEFLILSIEREASPRFDDGRRIYGGPRTNIPENDCVYSGFGLMINKKAHDPHTYERTGVFKFKLEAEGWKEMCKACGSNPEQSALDLPRRRVELI